MNVNVELLKSFVKKASLNGEIPTINLDFLEDGLYASVYDGGTVGLTITTLSRDAFEDYEALGEKTIRNTSLFLKMLGAFDSTVTISSPDEYSLKLSHGKQRVSFMLAARNVLNNIFNKERPSIDFKASGVVSKDDSKRVAKNLSLLQEDKVTFSFNNNLLSVSVGNVELSDHAELDLESFSGENNTRVTIGRLFSQFLKATDGEFSLSFANDSPIYLKEESEHLTFEAFIAPIVD
jgi:hypothetical protein